MSRSEQNVVREMCQAFLHDAVPEYIRDTAYYILSEGGVQKINIQEGETWEAQGVIQGEDLQVYTPSLTFSITDRSTRHQCNCSESFTSTCRHVAALALRLLEELRKEQGDAEEVTPPAKDWKQSFRSFFSTDMEPEPGKHYLIFRFQPEQGRLLVSFFRGRQNKSGLSSVHNEITLQQIINNPDWCEFSPQLPHVARQIGQHLDYYGHRVEIPDGLTSWFFWAVRKEYYLLWKDTDRPCRIESTPFALKLKPNFDDNGFSFDVLLKREGRPPLPIRANGAPSDHLHGAEAPEDAPITFHGQMPLWVCCQHNFYPVQTGLYPSLVHNLIYERPVVPQEEISEFLDRVWTRLPSSELYEPQQFLRMMEPVFQPATYNPKLFLDEEGSLLTLEIDNIYQTRHGEFTLNGPNPDFQTGSYTYEGQTYLVRRHQEEEAQLMNELAGMDFQARSSKLWFLEPEEAIAFLLDSYPTLVENYRVYGERALSRYKMRTAKSSISAEVVSNEKEKWFSLEISVDYEGQSLPLDKIWKAWTRGKRYVQLKDGSYTSLPESWLEKIAHKLTALGLDPSKPPQTKFKQFEAPVLDSLLEDLPGARLIHRLLIFPDIIRRLFLRNRNILFRVLTLFRARYRHAGSGLAGRLRRNHAVLNIRAQLRQFAAESSGVTDRFFGGFNRFIRTDFLTGRLIAEIGYFQLHFLPFRLAGLQLPDQFINRLVFLGDRISGDTAGTLGPALQVSLQQSFAFFQVFILLTEFHDFLIQRNAPRSQLITFRLEFRIQFFTADHLFLQLQILFCHDRVIRRDIPCFQLFFRFGKFLCKLAFFRFQLLPGGSQVPDRIFILRIRFAELDQGSRQPGQFSLCRI